MDTTQELTPKLGISSTATRKRPVPEACHACRSKKARRHITATDGFCDKCLLEQAEYQANTERQRSASLEERVRLHIDRLVGDPGNEADSTKDIATRLDRFLANAPQALDFEMSNKLSSPSGSLSYLYMDERDLSFAYIHQTATTPVC